MELAKLIIKPIPGKNTAGTCLPDSKLRGYLDNEIMKIGTLQHDDLDWVDLENKTISLLSKECKDFKILSYLMLCLQQDGNPERFLSSLQILAQFSEKYWFRGYPVSGQKGKVLKRKLAALMLNRSIKNSKNLKLLLPDMPLLSQYKTVVAKLEKLVTKHTLKVGKVKSILKKVEDELSTLEQPTAKKLKNTEQPASTTTVIGSVDLSGERKIKETYLKLAQFTNEIDAGNPLGYQLRRFGLWQTISAVPPKSKKGNTEMMVAPADRVTEYLDGIKNRASLKLLMRIEHTVETSPFWIQGSYLSATCATKLGMPKVSAAILESVKKFLKKLPNLAENNFSDGTEFVDAKTKQWLKNKQKQTSSVISTSDLTELYASQGLEATLNKINEQLEDAEGKRDICHLKLLAIEFLSESGMGQLAQTQLVALHEEIKEMLVQDWEPAFVQRLNLLKLNTK